MKGQSLLLAIIGVFGFLVTMLVVVPIFQSINTAGWTSWTLTLWALIIPFLFICAIIYLIWMATPEWR